MEPRTAYPKLRGARVPWAGRDEDPDDPRVWAVTCLIVRKGYRGRGLTYHLARAAVDFARQRGAEALEAALGPALATITAQDARGWFRLAGYAPAD